MRTIGVDLHKTMFVVCIIEGEQKTFHHYKIAELDKFVSTLSQDDKLAVESGSYTNYFVKQVKNKVQRVVVINTKQFKLISQSVKKTDKNDAELIATYLGKDLLPETRDTTSESNALKSLTGTRDKMVKTRSKYKNKLHSLLNYHGIYSKREDFSSEKSLRKVLEYNLPDLVKFELEIIVKQIRNLNETILEIDTKIEEYGSKLDGFNNIISIKGIGINSATILLSIIGNISDFENEKKLAAYFGLVPRIRQSNETIQKGRISKQGNKLGRTTLVQCGLVAQKYSPYLNNFYNRIKNNRGSGKAKVATARKLLSIIYNTLKNNLVFEDFPNFVLKQA